jgi:hypothetical protein
LEDEAANFVLRMVRQQPHTYTRQQLQEKASIEIPELTSQEMDAVLTGMTLGSNRMINFDANGKAVLRIPLQNNRGSSRA